ncbi:uncharacterized protein LOC6042593 isoform X1 [Culex quinquefasciatus]|uniref:uncharacterized protein LOC6042593 isoform X1 n=1 Tax=Culex quinquefasciatus TaxID=7176 RepID=UPI0018E3A90E|nr:uncharacterized protein LOC6042593 isoform X1 [Culex quinquefasciatus]
MAWRRQSLHLFHDLYEQLSAYVSWSESTWKLYWFNSGSFADQQYRHALILEFLLLLADTNSFVEGGPLLNLDHREDSINSNGLPAPVPMLAESRTGNSKLNIPEPDRIEGTLPRSEVTGYDWFMPKKMNHRHKS